MSTRGVTKFFYPQDMDNPVATVYRHTDSYPEGAGKDIHQFLDECAKLDDTRFDDPSYLAAKYVVFLASMFSRSTMLDFLSVGVVNAVPLDVEYIYHIICDTNNFIHPERPTVKCFRAVGDPASREPDGYYTDRIEGKEVEIK